MSGVVAKGDAWKQRKRIATMSMKDRMEDMAARDRNPMQIDEVKCQKCGFKARYKFHRCPECDEVQKS
jgi:lipopolysaccharide biosynthesis regulator YciM